MLPSFLPEPGLARELSLGLTQVIEIAVGVAIAIATLDVAKAMVVRGERRLVVAEVTITLLFSAVGLWLVW